MLYKNLLILVITMTFINCATNSDNLEPQFRLIPDRTPYIAGLIEATNDTVHHYPEVFVAYVSDPAFVDDPFNYFFYDNSTVYNSTLHAQITGTIRKSRLVTEHEEEAIVRVTGPIGLPEESSVRYKYEGEGVYGDTDSELILHAGVQYRLDVTLPDGRIYTRTTSIPTVSTLDVQDTVYTKVDYYRYGSGEVYESNRNDLKDVVFTVPEDSYITEFQYNTSHDDKLIFKSDEELMSDPRGQFLRKGIIYGVRTYESERRDTLKQSWNLNIHEIPKSDPDFWKSMEWYRVSHFSDEIGQRFLYMDNWISIGGEEEERISRMSLRFSFERDSTYLKKVSTILKRAEDGSILPKEQSDAIGFFAGYFSNYKTSVLIPQRTYDVDSILFNQ
jgi:hypothetical protein